MVWFKCMPSAVLVIVNFVLEVQPNTNTDTASIYTILVFHA